MWSVVVRVENKETAIRALKYYFMTDPRILGHVVSSIFSVRTDRQTYSPDSGFLVHKVQTNWYKCGSRLSYPTYTKITRYRGCFRRLFLINRWREVSRDSVLALLIMLRTEQSETVDWFRTGTKRFFTFPQHPELIWTPHSFLLNESWAIFP